MIKVLKEDVERAEDLLMFCWFTKVMVRTNYINNRPVRLCQWVTHMSWQLYLWTPAESKVEYCMRKHGRFDTHWVFAVDSHATYVLSLCSRNNVYRREMGQTRSYQCYSEQIVRWDSPRCCPSIKSHRTRDVNSAGCWVVKCSSVPVLGCRLCLGMQFSFYWHVDLILMNYASSLHSFGGGVVGDPKQSNSFFSEYYHY